MVAVVKEKADKDIVKKFSTPESIRELSDQLNNLDESMNGLYRQREKAPAPKKGVLRPSTHSVSFSERRMKWQKWI